MKQTKIERVDPYLPFYVFEKQQNPQSKLWWVAVKQKDLDTIDKLVEISKGKRETVTSEKDWEIMAELLKFFENRWPEEFKEFKEVIPQIRATRRAGGYSKNKETMYLGALPPRFERLIKAIFPRQQFNKDFMYKLVNRYKLFKVGGET
jgi:hypothetical protein